jgi:hypothetical protein
VTAECVRGDIRLVHQEPGAAVYLVIDLNGRFQRMGFVGVADIKKIDGETLTNTAAALAAWVRDGLGVGITGPGGDA